MYGENQVIIYRLWALGPLKNDWLKTTTLLIKYASPENYNYPSQIDTWM